jgi:hypothetical protein
MSKHEWRDHKTPYFFGARLILIDGTQAGRGEHVMRSRLLGGSWQYRKPTRDEADELHSEMIW